MMDSRSINRAMISVIEKARGRSADRPSSRLLSVVLMAVFFIALMSGLAVGAHLYQATVVAQTRANELHLESGLIAGVIHNNDFAGAARTDEGPEGPSLVLERRLASGTYETRIYHYQGRVLQEFAVAGRPYDPANATALLETDSFSFSVEDGLVSFATDQGSFVVALRSDPEAREQEPSVAPSATAAPVTIIDEGGM